MVGTLSMSGQSPSSSSPARISLIKLNRFASYAVIGALKRINSLAFLKPIIFGNIRVVAASGVEKADAAGAINFASGVQYRKVKKELRAKPFPKLHPLTRPTIGLTLFLIAIIAVKFVCIFEAEKAVYKVSFSKRVGSFP